MGGRPALRVARISALNLGIETVPTEGKPIISEMLSVILPA
jgi:hypothetical protein